MQANPHRSTSAVTRKLNQRNPGNAGSAPRRPKGNHVAVAAARRLRPGKPVPLARGQRAIENIELFGIKDAKLAAKVKQAADVARAAAVLLDFCAQSGEVTANGLETVAFALPVPLFAAYQLLKTEKREDTFWDLSDALQGAANTLQATEKVREESLPGLTRAVATLLREVADYTELRGLGTVGTMAQDLICADVLPVLMERQAAQMRADLEAGAQQPAATPAAA